MEKIKNNGTEVLYENPKPELKSKNAYFPGIIELPDKRLMACYVTGEAFESIDHTTEISISDDMGNAAFAVFFSNVVNDLDAAALAKVDIDVGRADALRVEETFE